MNVNTEPIAKDGSANTVWALKQAQIYGNKKITIVLEAQPNTAAAGNIVFAVVSQKDETGTDVTKFAYDTTTNLLKPTANIDNVTQLKFHHLVTYNGSNQSGGNGDANDNLAVVQRIVNTGANPQTETLEEIDRISSAVDLPDGETIQKRVVTEPEPPADPTATLGINSLIGLGWNIQAYGSPVITVGAVRVTIDINYYDPNAQGGN